MGCARIETNHRISDVNLFISRAIDVLKQDPGRRDQPVTKRFVCPCGCITARQPIWTQQQMKLSWCLSPGTKYELTSPR